MRRANARRFQFSVRSLLVITGVLALLMVPAASLTRERQQMLQAREALLHAREQALRAVVLAERGRVERSEIEAIAEREAPSPGLRPPSPRRGEGNKKSAVLSQFSPLPTGERASVSGSGVVVFSEESPKKPSLPLEFPTLLEQLERENAALKDRVELLSREVERLKAANRQSSPQASRLGSPGAR